MEQAAEIPVADPEANGNDEVPPELTPEEQAKLEKEMEGGIGFNIGRLIDLMNQVIESFANKETPINVYTDTYFEWTKLFKHLGPAIAIAFKGKWSGVGERVR